MTSTTTSPSETEPITAGQRRALFAIAKARGLDTNGIRAMTPQGSISKLSREEASLLLDRLNANASAGRGRTYERPPRLPKGVYRLASDAQHRKAEALRMDLNWTPDKLREFLAERHYADGRAMATDTKCPAMDSSHDGVEVIELLKSIFKRTEQAKRRRRSQPADPAPDQP